MLGVSIGVPKSSDFSTSCPDLCHLAPLGSPCGSQHPCRASVVKMPRGGCAKGWLLPS